MFASHRLRARLRDREMSQEKFARECDVSLMSVQKWCAGAAQPTFANVLRMSQILDEPPQWFSVDDDELDTAA